MELTGSGFEVLQFLAVFCMGCGNLGGIRFRGIGLGAVC
jgi:hypothetical protein